MKIVRILAACACLMLLCSCSTRAIWSGGDSLRPPLPPETSFNKDAGHGNHLFVRLHLANSEDLLFGVDTGSPYTMLDKSLEPILGKRLGKMKFAYEWAGSATVDGYEAPKLYLGGVQLLTGDRVFTDDLKRMGDDLPLMGILGMDCLRHYCIQLDFAADKMRFLDPDQPTSENLGKAFPLRVDSFKPSTTHANFLRQGDADYVVDTGDVSDAALKPKLFSQELGGQTVQMTLQTKTFAGVKVNEAFLPNTVFNGEACTNFILGERPDGNLIGIRFLARHLTTLNFPKQTMYLQRRNDEPFADENNFINASGYAYTMEAQEFFLSLKSKGQLPGWLKEEHGGVSVWTPNKETAEIYPISRTFIATKSGGVSEYRYTVVKVSRNAIWKLQRAWRTDAKGHVVEEYPIP